MSLHVTDESNPTQIGVSAQDVQRVYPELVRPAPFDTSNLESGELVSKSGSNFITVCYERTVRVHQRAEDLKLRVQK